MLELPQQSIGEGFGRLMEVGEKIHLDWVLKEGPEMLLLLK